MKYWHHREEIIEKKKKKEKIKINAIFGALQMKYT